MVTVEEIEHVSKLMKIDVDDHSEYLDKVKKMISSLSLMENANSESEVFSIGISVIMLNLGMYLGVPAIVVVGIRKKF